MEFRIQDIVKNVIPGTLVILGIIIGLECFLQIDFKVFFENYVKDAGEIWLIVLLISSYIAGYIIDALSSDIEYVIYLMIPKPSFLLLNNSSKRYKLSNLSEVNQALGVLTAAPYDKAICANAFKKANNLKDSNPSELIKK
jgi:hypothetical protein